MHDQDLAAAHDDSPGGTIDPGPIESSHSSSNVGPAAHGTESITRRASPAAMPASRTPILAWWLSDALWYRGSLSSGRIPSLFGAS